MTADRYLQQLSDDTARIRTLLSDGDLAAPVPGCPGWDLADLGGHIGGIYRFAATAIFESRSIDEAVGPRERAELLGWFDAGAGQVGAALAARAWDEPCWTMAPPANTGFWARRICQETSLHLWDAQQSQDEPGMIDSELAADGVAEVVTMFFPRQVRLRRIAALTGSLELRIQDLVTANRLVLAGDGTGPAPPIPDAVLRGPAESLLLLLWKRTSLHSAEFTLTGDHNTARHILATAITP